jgi:hypothetical protein
VDSIKSNLCSKSARVALIASLWPMWLLESRANTNRRNSCDGVFFDTSVESFLAKVRPNRANSASAVALPLPCVLTLRVVIGTKVALHEPLSGLAISACRLQNQIAVTQPIP